MEHATSNEAKERARRLSEYLGHEMEEFEVLQKRRGIVKVLESDQDVTTVEAAVRRIDAQLRSFQLAVISSIEKNTEVLRSIAVSGREQSALQTLYRVTATDASHDSGERFPPPQCHPQTRTDILQQFSHWASTNDPSTRILWLHGPAGAGKSAIAQTLCQEMAADDHPVASFFFKRGDPSRGESMKLFPTIAYQLAYLIPEFRTAIVDCVGGAHIFNKPLSTQLKTLIMEPWHQLPNTHNAIVVIDGLDECTGEKRQQEIVRSIAQGFIGNPTPLRFLIASRPEPHIAELFQEPSLQNIHREINIAPSFTDIHTFLRDEFGRISQDHRMMVGVTAPWPSHEVLEHLIQRSSGYFIYAATVIKFINDPDFRPTDRLNIIMGMAKPKHGSPYAALDQLYTQILDEVPDGSQLLRILAVLAAHHVLPMFQIEQLLGLESGDVWLTLRRARSVLDVPSQHMDTTPLRSHHASFIDFLQDEARSGAFFTGPGSIRHQHLGAHVLDALSYTCKDQSLNAVGHVAWEFNEEDIIQCLPTEDLVARLRPVNPDFIVKFPDSQSSSEKVLEWLKTIQPAPPEDLIQVWEAYHFMAVCDGAWRRAPRKTRNAAIDVLLDINLVLAWTSPHLIELFHAYVLLYDSVRGPPPSLDKIRHVLDYSWDDLRRIICPLRETVGQDSHALELLFLSACHPTRINEFHPAATLQHLAQGGMRTMINVTTNHLPVRFYAAAPLWGSVLRACPPDTKLLETLIESERASAISDPERPSNTSNVHNAIEWLKTFPESPRQLIERIQELLPNSDNSRGASTNVDVEDLWVEWKKTTGWRPSHYAA
ncbi:hypothetical protein FB45DRAFT_1057137 [Roridomyces roridus]|uniref:NACHT domain-containing protein n=1 Tax=Roridomyces roridus TaxID=1738132 RepID=A0AAD7C045_9AGAR|nr:hypothetical protein FB45DRAFT_1057137 [Roridomyces roridus]